MRQVKLSHYYILEEINMEVSIKLKDIINSTKLKEIIEENGKMCQDFDPKLCIYGNGEDEYNKDD